jgi:hypothetical protein
VGLDPRLRESKNFELIVRNDIEISGKEKEDVGKSKKDLLRALDMLEKANETRSEIHYEERQESGFWSRLLNPFKCG